MMGKKTVREYREELRQRLAATGEDPIACLEKQIATGKSRHAPTEVLESIKRVLERAKPKKPRKRKVLTKAPTR